MSLKVIALLADLLGRVAVVAVVAVVTGVPADVVASLGTLIAG